MGTSGEGSSHSSALPSRWKAQSGGLERFRVFKKLKSKSAIIFLKYILLNEISILDASSKL